MFPAYPWHPTEEDKISDLKKIGTMKALSIKQPWAWLIAHGFKDIENRSWKYPPSYRGEMLIHASKSFDYEGYFWVLENFSYIPLPPPEITTNRREISAVFNRGGFVGRCKLNDVVTESDSRWFFGPLGFVLSEQEPIHFIKHPGQLGLFNPPAKILPEIHPKL